MADNFRLRAGTSLPIFADGNEYFIIEEVSTNKRIGHLSFVQFQGEADREAYEQRKEAARLEAVRMVNKMNGLVDA